MADFSLGSSGTGRLETWVNWDNSYQASFHYKLSAEIRNGAYNAVGDASWNGSLAGGYVGSGNWTYTSNGWRTLREFDVTINKDANGYLTVNSYGYINGANGGSVGAGSASFNVGTTRQGVAPSIAANTADTVTATSVRLGTEINNVGLGTSASCRFYYKTVADASWTATGDQADVGGYNYFNVTGLVPNTKYYRLARWWNNNGDTGDLPSTYPSESYFFVTLASATVGAVSPLATTVDIPLTVTTGFYAPTSKIQYRKTGDATWIDSATSTSGTPTIALSGLLPNTQYDYRPAVTTTSGTWEGTTSTFTTLPAGKLVYPDGTVKNAIPRRINADGTTTMVNINIIDPV